MTAAPGGIDRKPSPASSAVGAIAYGAAGLLPRLEGLSPGPPAARLSSIFYLRYIPPEDDPGAAAALMPACGAAGLLHGWRSVHWRKPGAFRVALLGKPMAAANHHAAMPLLDWIHVYGQIFPTMPAGTFFDRLRTETARLVLVTGCQRSGTTWFTKLLGSCLHGAVVPKELEVCNYLINNLDFALSDAAASTLVLQTTFVNTEVRSYAKLADEIPVIAIARNPFSVCWSMVSNWGNLALEHARRSRTTYDANRVRSEEELWRMAIQLYRESAEATAAIVRERPDRTRLLIYDELIRDIPAELARLAGFLNRTVATRPAALDADLRPAAKHLSMPTRYRQLVAEQCASSFVRLNEMAHADRLEIADGRRL